MESKSFAVALIILLVVGVRNCAAVDRELGKRITELTLKIISSRRQNFRLQIFKKMLSPSYIILGIQRLEGKQCRSR